MKFDWSLGVFEDVTGQLREIRSCSILSLSDFRDYLELLQEALSANPEKEFLELYLNSSYVSQIVDRCLRICGVEPEWLSADMLVQMLHHQTNEESGDFKAGILVEFMFPDKGNKSGKKIDFKEWVSDTIASLVSLGLAANLKEAIDLARTVPADQLEAIVMSRAYQSDPKLKKRHNLESAASEISSNPAKMKEMLTFEGKGKWVDASLEDLNRLL